MKKTPLVSGVLLGAGEAKRWGTPSPKQLLLWDSEPLIRVLAKRALQSSLSELTVVTGHMAEDIESVLSDLKLTIVVNRGYREGLSSSVKLGLSQVNPSAHAAIFLPSDQPFLSSALLDQLILTYQQTAAPIVLPRYGERLGSPVLFDRSLFPELRRISGDEGGRQVLKLHQAATRFVSLDNEKPLLDIDTLADYDKLMRT